MNRGGGYAGHREEIYTLVTDGAGNMAQAHTPPFKSIISVQPVCLPPADSTTRVRVTASDLNGFTIKTERNAGVNVLGIDVLTLGTSNVPGVSVTVLVVGT